MDVLLLSFHLPDENLYRVNITLGSEEERLMLSGLHTVEDIFCCCCGQILGWKYVSLFFSLCFNLFFCSCPCSFLNKKLYLILSENLTDFTEKRKKYYWLMGKSVEFDYGQTTDSAKYCRTKYLAITWFAFCLM